MKERYETRIQEMEEEKDILEEKVLRLETQIEKLQSMPAASSGNSAGSSMNLLDEVKSTSFSIMPQPFTTQSRLLTTLTKRPFENITGKGENAGNQHFLLFP